MIKRFRHRGLKRLFENDDKAAVGADLREKLENRLAVLDRAAKPQDMSLPGYHLKPMSENMKGFGEVVVQGNWRLVWRFEGTDAVASI